ncbi:hypothetical protein HY988_01795 [Candidatus Micrarchaeota archaeon]|nr:hypothetical protein [Candidatus Micrarchaeota archaeon]
MADKYNLIFLFFISLFLISVSYAADNFDFGSMQQEKIIQGEPGQNITLNIFFFVDEEYGNRITHISIRESEAPDGWPIAFNPPSHQEYLNISGVIVTSNENIYVEPKPVLPKMPDVPENGTYYLLSPSGKGYLQAKKLEVQIAIPKNAQLGKTYEIKLNAEAAWFGEGGNIALKQNRPFSYSIVLAKKGYSEQVVKPETLGQNSSQNSNQNQTGSAIDTNAYLMGGLLAIIIALVGYVFLTRERKVGLGQNPGKNKPKKK